ncbi:MAG: DUF4173 domain-containing protein [Bacteroidetes bacterium]|nr:DUF4173 domain-containing protein [Bacteroidota bacterium]
MNKNKLAFTFLIVGTVIYDYLFWKENFGINVLIFSSLLMATMVALYPQSFRNRNVLLVAIGTMLSAVFEVIHNSGSSKLIHLASFFMLIGFIHQGQLRSMIAAGLTALTNYFFIPGRIMKEIGKVKSRFRNVNKFLKLLKLTIIPLLVVIVFYIIYKNANPVFEKYALLFLDDFFQFLTDIFRDVSLSHFLFAVFGMVLIGGAIFSNNIHHFLDADLRKTDKLIRKRRSRKIPGFAAHEPRKWVPFAILGLKNEYLMGLILIFSVNALILVVNIIDINWIWINFEVKEGFNLSQFVHEGTYLLILSIIISMGILLYFFRGNLNFFKQNKWLKYGAYTWIVQNGFMVLSVALRNYHYINHYGLAYKRIGVIVFLILVLVGLLTLYLKIQRSRSTYYLVNMNSWATYIAMIMLCFFNWDALIARHNLNHKYQSNMDVRFLMNLSSKALPLLLENRDILKKEIELYYNSPDHWENYENRLNGKVQRFLNRYDELSWQSWNYADYKTYKYITEHEKI